MLKYSIAEVHFISLMESRRNSFHSSSFTTTKAVASRQSSTTQYRRRQVSVALRSVLSMPSGKSVRAMLISSITSKSMLRMMFIFYLYNLFSFPSYYNSKAPKINEKMWKIYFQIFLRNLIQRTFFLVFL